MFDVAVLGAGGVGGFLAAALANARVPTLVVGREATAREIAERGIAVESERLGAFRAEPGAATALTLPVDVLIVAPKARDLEAALERVETEPGLALPLLNGLDHMTVLRERFGSRAVSGSIRIEAYRTDATHVVQTSPFLRIDMASADPAMAPRMDALAGVLDGAGVPARVMDSEAQALWGKLVRLNALALVTSAYDLRLGPIRATPELRDELRACVREGVAVATAEGARVELAATLAELDDAHASLGTSMQRDIAAGVEPELDAIAGSVLRAAARHGIECPTIERLTELVAAQAGVRVTAALPR